MVVFWKVIFTILILYTISIDGNRARRRRRQAQVQNPNLAGNNIGQPALGPNPQVLNAPGQDGQNDIRTGKQGGRQYYYPYQGQTGYGSIQSLNYPYSGSGVGNYQYGTGQYGQVGAYGNYYNPYQGSNSFYSGYGGGGGSYNPSGYGYGSGSSNYYPSSGSNYFGGGGYYWGAAQRQNINMYTIFLSSLLTLIIGFMLV